MKQGNQALRKKLIGAVLGIFVLAGLGYGAYWGCVARNEESTDNAYVDGNVVQITPHGDSGHRMDRRLDLRRTDPAAVAVASTLWSGWRGRGC